MSIHVLVFKLSMLEMHAILHFFFSAIVSTSNDFFGFLVCKIKGRKFSCTITSLLRKNLQQEGDTCNSILTFIVMYPWQKETRPGPGLMKDLSLKS